MQFSVPSFYFLSLMAINYTQYHIPTLQRITTH
jgi:hypothetical protein